MWRGSLPCSAASSRARSPGTTSARATTRPSALETTLCATTSTSPARSRCRRPRSAREVVARATSGGPGQREELEHGLIGGERGRAPARVRGAAAEGVQRAAHAAKSLGVSTSSPSALTSATSRSRRRRVARRSDARTNPRRSGRHHVGRREQERVVCSRGGRARSTTAARGGACRAATRPRRGSSAGQLPGTSSTRSEPRSSAPSTPARRGRGTGRASSGRAIDSAS